MNFNKHLIRSVIVSVAIMLFAGVFGVANLNAQVLKEILDRMDGNYKTLSTFRSNVTMVKYNDQIGSRDTTEGKTAYISQSANKQKIRYIRVDWTKPVEENIVVIGDKYQLYRPRLGQAIRGTTSSAKNSGAAGGALAFTTMSKADLQANYVVQYKGEEGISGEVKTWHLFLTPKNKTSYKSADLWVDTDGMPRQAMITESNDDTTTILLTNIEKNPNVNPSEFNTNLPANTKIIPG